MKKKFLSLMMAVAVVSTTSVSAFAAEHKLTTLEEEKKVEVEIEGKVEDSSGNVLPSTVTVTVPTSLNFTVTKEGTVVSPGIEITNSGDEPVSVIATEFIDTTGDKKINIKKDGPLTKRSEVNLRLVGGDESITLTSESKGPSKSPGKMYNSAGNAIEESGILLKDITASNSLTLKIEGEGKKITDEQSSGSENDAINDTFKLKLKFKKKREN